jgi:cysteine sulfinate desulfinase/cysteine desulfurase-like protein
MRQIYLDFNATTPIDPRVAESMRAAMNDGYGNPSSPHWAGAPAKRMVEASRKRVASLLSCSPEEVVFTSGGSEANNFALKGAFFARGDRPAHIITTQIEHPSILVPCEFLERQGARVTYLPVDDTGLANPDDVRRVITRNTHANNETGTIQPIEECAGIAREHGCRLSFIPALFAFQHGTFAQRVCGLPEFLSKPYLSNCHCHNEEKMTLSVGVERKWGRDDPQAAQLNPEGPRNREFAIR